MTRQVTLVVEDGSIVSGANSFVNEQAIVDYALMRGVTLPFSSDEEKDAVAVLGIQAMDYLNFMPWRGEPVSSTQTTPWPRKNTGTTFPENQIPYAVKEAELQLTLLVKNGVVLVNNSTGMGFLVKEKIGPIENVYSEKVGVSSNGLAILPGIQALLDPWLLPNLDGILPVGIWSIGSRSYGC